MCVSTPKISKLRFIVTHGVGVGVWICVVDELVVGLIVDDELVVGPFVVVVGYAIVNTIFGKGFASLTRPGEVVGGYSVTITVVFTVVVVATVAVAVFV
jgi:hypothetical protein